MHLYSLLLSIWTLTYIPRCNSNELTTLTKTKKQHLPTRGKNFWGMGVSQYRLPTTVYPVSYNITIHPYFSNFTFNGQENIDLVILKDALFNENDWLIIEINAFDIMINYCTLYIDKMKHAIPMKSASVDTTTQIVAMKFKIRNSEILKYMKKHQYKYSINAMLFIQYIGIIQIDMKGFYISSFRYNNKLIHNGVTHFEATNARKFYPCFDEPALKATFTITLIAPAKASVIGNALAHEKASPRKDCYFNMHDGEHYDCKIVQFETTPKMSTYLTAVAIGDYNFVEGSMNGVNQRIYFPLQNPKRAKFALDMSLKVLTFYEKLLRIKFPLSKMYSLAVNDFKAGAMENLGMVTYRDIRLMCDMKKSTLNIKQHVALVIAHEFSHQWFGNLVTMSWWSDIWLNEGFAAFMEFVGGNHVHPEYLLWDTFYFETHRAMLRDASSETHQIVLKVEDPTDVRALFDGITYHKGAGVLHMLYQYLGGNQQHTTGPDSGEFFVKIRQYLNKYKFSNANTEQLFDELGGKKVINMMNSWVKQAGLPMLKVDVSVREDGKVHFVLTQERIRPRIGGQTRIGVEQLWEIPVKVLDADGTYNDLDLMRDKSIEFVLDASKYYIINPEMHIFAFTYYDRISLELLIDSFHLLSKVDQFLVVADRFSLMSFNFISGDDYIEFLRKIVEKIDLTQINSLLWRMVIDSLIFIDDIFCELHNNKNAKLRELRIDFRAFGRDMLRPVWHKINGFGDGNNEHEQNREIIILRPLLLSALVRFDDVEIIEGGYNILANVLPFKLDTDGYIDCFESIDKNILEQLMEAALSYHNGEGSGTENEIIFEELISIYTAANNEIQSQILGAIGAVYANAELLEAAVDFVLSHAVRLNVKGHGMASLRRCYGREQVWNDLLRRSRGAPRQVGMASTFAKQSIYNLVYSYYFGSHNGLILKLPVSKTRIIKSVLEKIALNIKFLNKNKFKIMKWTKKYQELKKNSKEYAAHQEVEEFDFEQGGESLRYKHLSRKEKRYKQQINGITKKTKTLSPKESLMLMITLFFVIMSMCLIALWLYSVHKNTLII